MEIESDGTDVGAVYFRCDGALQEIHGNDEPVGSSCCDQNSFQVGKWAGLHAHSLTYAEKRMRAAAESGPDNGLNCLNFSGCDRRRLAPEPDNVFYVGRGEHGKAV